ncbi:MAG: Kelch repeat-containing protein [Cytophagaceae bacterium]
MRCFRNFCILIFFLILFSCKKVKGIEPSPNITLIQSSYTLIPLTSETGINDTVIFSMNCVNENKSNLEIIWFDKESGTMIKSVQTSTPTILDTIKYAWPSLGSKVLINTVKYNGQIIHSKEALIEVVKDPVLINMPRHMVANNIGEIVNIKAHLTRNYGKISKIEFDFDGSEEKYSYTQVSKPDTSFTFEKNVYVYLRVTDDDNDIYLDSTRVTLPMWNNKGSFSYNWNCIEKKIGRYNDLLYIGHCNELTSYNFLNQQVEQLPAVGDINTNNYSLLSFNERLLIIGTTVSSSIIRVFNINTRAFETNITLPESNFRNGCAEENNGKIYLMFPNGNLHIYNLMTGEWNSGNSLPEPRRGASSNLHDGKIYVSGGRNSENKDVTTILIYDINSNTWTTGTPLPFTKSYHTSTVYKNKIYIFGGGHSSGSINDNNLIFDLQKNTWESFPQPDGMLFGVSTKCIDLEDRILIFTGEKVVEFFPENR